MPLYASECMFARVLFFYPSHSTFPARIFIVFRRILKVFLYVLPLMKIRSTRSEGREEKSFKNSFPSRFVFGRMNTKTTYFKILNTNCAEETMKHCDRVRGERRDLSITFTSFPSSSKSST